MTCTRPCSFAMAWGLVLAVSGGKKNGNWRGTKQELPNGRKDKTCALKRLTKQLDVPQSRGCDARAKNGSLGGWIRPRRTKIGGETGVGWRTNHDSCREGKTDRFLAQSCAVNLRGCRTLPYLLRSDNGSVE